jgi:hypothetical protein
VTQKQRLTSKRLGCGGSFRPHAGQRSAITDNIPLERQNRPAPARNTVRHHTGILSAIIPESVSGMVRITQLLHAEQGYGDTIQFSRYCTHIASLGGRVILSAPKDLHSLFRTLQGVEEVVEQAVQREFDVHCPLMSLPLALGTEVESIPAPMRYLKADPAATAQWAGRLKGGKEVPKIGLVWSGRATHAKDLERSIGFKNLLPILEHPAQWISLQKEVRASDAADLSSTPGVLRIGEELTDFADTAALIENLDLIVTVDTAVAHLAGALGKPVWILLPYVADWRWFQDREDSPWYPTARLFRQSARGEWTSVIGRVARCLQTEFPVSTAIPELSKRKARRSGSRARKK